MTRTAPRVIICSIFGVSFLVFAGTYDARAQLDDIQALDRRALDLSEAGRYGEAEPLYQRALAIAEKVHGPGHPNTATILNNLAVLYLRQERSGEAGPLAGDMWNLVADECFALVGSPSSQFGTGRSNDPGDLVMILHRSIMRGFLPTG